MDDLEHIAAAVQFLMRSLVDHPEELVVTVREVDAATVQLDVVSSPRDVGRVIGLQGRTARAFRTILVSISGQLDRRMILNINEDPRKLT